MRVFYFCGPVCSCRIGASDCEECERVDFVNDTPRICAVCDSVIAIGAVATKLTNVDEYTKRVAPQEYGEVQFLHSHCADAYTLERDEYFRNIHD